jgi:hypothetical protein
LATTEERLDALEAEVADLKAQLAATQPSPDLPMPPPVVPMRTLPQDLYTMLGTAPPPGRSWEPSPKAHPAVGLGPDQPGGPPLPKQP